MKRRIPKILILTLSAFCILKSQDTLKYLSLKECLKIGMESSQSIINANLDKEKSKYQKQESLSGLLPQIEGFGTYDNYVKLPVTMIPGEIFGQPGTTIPVSLATKHNITTGLKATQILYNHTSFMALGLSEKMKEISNINFDKTQKDLIYDITHLYLLIKTTEGQKNILEENIKRLDRLIKISESQLEAGLIRQVDFERIKVNKENLLTELINLDVIYRQQKEMLQYSIGIKNKLNYVLSDSLQNILIDNNSFASVSESKRPEALLFEKQKELALINKKMVITGYLPTLSVYGQYFFQGQRDKFDFFESGETKWFKVGVVGLSFSLPIFDGFNKQARLEQSEADYLQASNNYEFTQRYHRIEYETALNKYYSNKKSESRQIENIKLAEKIYDKMLLQYQQGISSLTDLLDAENSLSETRLNGLNTTFNLRIAELDLLKASDNLKSIINK